MGLHGLVLAQHGLVVAQVATAFTSASWWHIVTQKYIGCKLKNESAVYPMRNHLGTTMIHHESTNGAARLMQPWVGALISIPHTAMEGHRFGLSHTHPCLPDGLTQAGRTELAGAQTLFPVTDLDVTPGV